MDSSKKGGGIMMLVVVLGLITFVCALLLGVINDVTKDKIEQNNIDKRNAAMAEIIPDAEFADVEVAAEWKTPADKNQPVVSGVYEAVKGGEHAGYCVQVEPKGFADADRRHQCGRHGCRRKGDRACGDPGPWRKGAG